MKKSSIIITIGLIAAALIVLLIIYMRPNIAASTVHQLKDDTNVASNIDDTSEQNGTVAATEAVATAGSKQTDDEDGNVDFNAIVYGSSLTGEDIVNEDGTITPDPSNGLNNPASDPTLEPIDPADDPANQIYSAPPSDESPE